MRLTLLQTDTTVGAVRANAQRLRTLAEGAVAGGAELVVTPELALSGYPPRDLLAHEGFVETCERTVRELASAWTHVAPLVLGTPWLDDSGRPRNALCVLRRGAIEGVYFKRLLPTYDVFDEWRYFRPGEEALVVGVGAQRVGLAICEDLWRGGDIVSASGGTSRYENLPDPIAELVRSGATSVVVASASPFTHDKMRDQRAILREHARRHRIPIASANIVGANDDLVFPGASAVVRADGALIGAGALFEEDTVSVDLADDAPPVEDPLGACAHEELLFRALVSGIRGYFRKVRAERCVLGVSGGIDSALVGALASAALGPENVYGLAMPSRYSSEHSVEDARALCARLGARFALVPIGEMHDAVEGTLRTVFAELGVDGPEGVAEENVQSRLRGLSVMAFANKAGAIALATGNKSELAVGYCTLYGDMNGGLAVIGDVLKSDVYALARWINDHHERCGFDRPPIPSGSITKPPSAELRPGQLDQDSLPPYDVLDTIIRMYVEERRHPADIVRTTGYDEALVRRYARTIDANEHKRKQMPIGIKVSPIAFGRGRRRPLAQGWDHADRSGER